MGPIRSLCTIAITSFVLAAEARIIPIQKHFRHEAVQLAKRQDEVQPSPRPSYPISASASTTGQVQTYITPSPGAAPVAITEQSQVVTSFIPEYTLCQLPDAEILPITPVTPQLQETTIPFRNYSLSFPESGVENETCTTIYSSTESTVCATTLTGLNDVYPVSECDQEITFSSQFGYVLATPTPTGGKLTMLNASGAVASITPGPAIETLTTYYLAPWQSLTSSGRLPLDIDLKVCRTHSNGTIQCVREYEVWSPSTLTYTTTLSTFINISTTLSGPSEIILETFVANITDQMTTFRLTSEMMLEYETGYMTTIAVPRTTITGIESGVTETSLGPTVSNTLTVEEASDEATTTSTVTITSTSTTILGTTTIGDSTSATAAAPANTTEPIASVDPVASVASVASAEGPVEPVGPVGPVEPNESLSSVEPVPTAEPVVSSEEAVTPAAELDPAAAEST